MLIGLARTSTLEQEAGLDAQKRTLTDAGCEKLFVEQVSSVGPRPGLEAAIEWSREGDVLVVTDLSRLARNVTDFCRIQRQLAERHVHLRVLNIGMDSATPSGALYLNLMAAISQWEREIMLQRQREGVAKARAAGKYRGRAPTARAKADQVRALDQQRMRKTQIAKELGISVRSVHRLLADSSPP